VKEESPPGEFTGMFSIRGFWFAVAYVAARQRIEEIRQRPRKPCLPCNQRRARARLLASFGEQ